MKIAQIFWRKSPLKKGTGIRWNKSMGMGVDRRIWFNPCGELEALKANFLLVEHPMVINLPVPIVDVIFEPPNTRTWRPVLYAFAGPGIEFHMAKRGDANVVNFREVDNNPKKESYLVYDPAPRWMEVLIELSRLHFDPLMDTDPKRALQKGGAFFNFEVLDDFAPRELERQGFIVALRWPDWERKRMTWDERGADLERNGVRFNKNGIKNTDALEHRCRRLGLKRGGRIL
jgi:hypothetical protein